MNKAKPTMMKLMMDARNFPYFTAPHAKSSKLFTSAAFIAGFKIIGVIMSATKELTIAVKAAPITTATAKSTTLPLIKNALNSFSITSFVLYLMVQIYDFLVYSTQSPVFF
jgi:hypothetical protein